jgi:hypothetical protein
VLADCIETDCKVPNLADILEPSSRLRLATAMRVRLRLEYETLERELAAAYRDVADLDPLDLSRHAYEALFRDFESVARRALSGEVPALELLPQITRRFASAVAAFHGSTQCSFLNLDQAREVLRLAAELITPPSARVKRRSERAAAPPRDSEDSVRASIRRLAEEDGKRLDKTKGPPRLKKLHPSWSRDDLRDLIGQVHGPRGPGRPEKEPDQSAE